jgi:nicotinamidase-related amidase
MSGPKVAVLLIDVINAFDFEGSEGLTKAAERVVPNIQRLMDDARALEVPVVYVNDNFGQWRSDFKATIDACTAPDKPGHRVSKALRPRETDYFVLKPQHSGFFSTTLSLLLEHLDVDTLVLAGFATNICVLFTANDAHMQGYHLIVPEDCTASNTPALTRAALDHVQQALNASTISSERLDFSTIRTEGKKDRGQPFRSGGPDEGKT